MNTRPQISVCIPAYNHAAYVRICVESALNQTLPVAEVIVTDDGSTDGTVEQIEAISDSRLQILRNARNQGPGAALNRCLGRATGDYLCFLASDDFFHPEKVERQFDYLQNHRAGLVFTGAEIVGESGISAGAGRADPISEPTERPREAWLADFFHGTNRLVAPSVMVRRDVVDRVGLFDPRLLQTQDLDYWIRSALHFEFGVIPQHLLFYRKRDNNNNASANSPDKQARTLWELPKVLNRFREIPDAEQFFRIFPDAQKLKDHNLSLDSLLAIYAAGAQESFVRMFGLDLLYELLGNAEAAGTLERAGFGSSFLFGLAGKAGLAGQWELDQAMNWKAAHAQIDAAYADLTDTFKKVEHARDWWREQAANWEASSAQYSARVATLELEAARTSREVS